SKGISQEAITNPVFLQNPQSACRCQVGPCPGIDELVYQALTNGISQPFLSVVHDMVVCKREEVEARPLDGSERFRHAPEGVLLILVPVASRSDGIFEIAECNIRGSNDLPKVIVLEWVVVSLCLYKGGSTPGQH